MDAREALTSYGYTLDDASGFYYRGDTEAWKPEGDGWICVRPAGGRSYAGPGIEDPAQGAPWGRAIDGVPGWVQVPFGLTERFQNVGGLHPATHPECFEWVWPEARVLEIYQYAHAGEGDNPWVRQEDGTLVPA